MSLLPRAIALQGIGYTLALVAAQGLLPADSGGHPAGRIRRLDSGRHRRIRQQNQALIAALTAMAAQGAFQ